MGLFEKRRDGKDRISAVADAVRSHKTLDDSAFKARLAKCLGGLGLGVLANVAIANISLGRTARAVASAPVGLWMTGFGLATVVVLLGRFATISPRGFSRAALVTAILLGFIIVSGAAVRLSGSGLGCPDWPTCKGGHIVPGSGRGAAIEFGNRVVTGLCIMAAAICVLLAFVRIPFRRDLARDGLVISLLIFGNAVVGGMVVLFHLKSGIVTAHFVLSIASLTLGLLLFHRSKEAEPSDLFGRTRHWVVGSRTRRALQVLTLLFAIGFLFGTVATGSGPHSGDPAKTERYPLDLESVVRAHSAVMWVALATLVGLALTLNRNRASGARQPELLRRLTILMGAVVAQGTLGYVQWFKRLPSGLVELHVLFATIIWTLIIWVRVSASEPGGQAL